MAIDVVSVKSSNEPPFWYNILVAAVIVIVVWTGYKLSHQALKFTIKEAIKEAFAEMPQGEQ